MKHKTALCPPNPNELLMATFTSFATPVSAVTFTEHASSCSFTLIVGGIKSSPTALIHAIASIDHAAPN